MNSLKSASNRSSFLAVKNYLAGPTRREWGNETIHGYDGDSFPHSLLRASQLWTFQITIPWKQAVGLWQPINSICPSFWWWFPIFWKHHHHLNMCFFFFWLGYLTSLFGWFFWYNTPVGASNVGYFVYGNELPPDDPPPGLTLLLWRRFCLSPVIARPVIFRWHMKKKRSKVWKQDWVKMWLSGKIWWWIYSHLEISLLLGICYSWPRLQTMLAGTWWAIRDCEKWSVSDIDRPPAF